MNQQATPLRSYLDLAPRGARLHRRESRMTRLCILLSVFLVTAIFSMVDMELRNQKYQTILSDGNWHVSTADLTAGQAAIAAVRPEIEAVGRYAVLNYRLDGGYTLAGKALTACGVDEGWRTEIFPQSLTEGDWPAAADEAVLTANAAPAGIAVGDVVLIGTPGGAANVRVTGFMPTTTMLAAKDALGALLTPEGLAALGATDEPVTYLRFTRFCNYQKAMAALRADFGLPEDALSENFKLMMLSLQSSNSYSKNLYGIAVFLLALVLLSGVLMITGTLNSNVSNRTQFFGMLRCLGATRRQIMRYVRREALAWCALAVPAGLALGLGVTWVLCALLRWSSPVYFANMPFFDISGGALVMGAVSGLLTVLLAARAPARRAARVSPLTAVSGNAAALPVAGRVRAGRRVELTLGIHHATGSKKNLLLVAGSFAVSIILFLGFSTFITFMNKAVTPLRPNTPDLYYFMTEEGAGPLLANLRDQLQSEPGIKALYGGHDNQQDWTPLPPDAPMNCDGIGVQLTRDATEAGVETLRALAVPGLRFYDMRAENRSTRALYFSLLLFIYGFLAIIALISALNIVNQIAMSAAARTRQYAAMRAIGMSGAQLTRMLRAEAATYAVAGCALGLALGVPVHRNLYRALITARWGTVWTMPWAPLAVIVGLVLASTALAVYAPARRLRRLPIAAALETA